MSEQLRAHFRCRSRTRWLPYALGLLIDVGLHLNHVVPGHNQRRADTPTVASFHRLGEDVKLVSCWPILQ